MHVNFAIHDVQCLLMSVWPSALKRAGSELGFVGEGRSDSAVLLLPLLCLARGTTKKFHLNHELYYEAFSGRTFPLECTLAGKLSSFSSKCSCSYLCKSIYAFLCMSFVLFLIIVTLRDYIHTHYCLWFHIRALRSQITFTSCIYFFCC